MVTLYKKVDYKNINEYIYLILFIEQFTPLSKNEILNILKNNKKLYLNHWILNPYFILYKNENIESYISNLDKELFTEIVMYLYETFFKNKSFNIGKYLNIGKYNKLLPNSFFKERYTRHTLDILSEVIKAIIMRCAKEQHIYNINISMRIDYNVNQIFPSLIDILTCIKYINNNVPINSIKNTQIKTNYAKKYLEIFELCLLKYNNDLNYLTKQKITYLYNLFKTNYDISLIKNIWINSNNHNKDIPSIFGSWFDGFMTLSGHIRNADTADAPTSKLFFNKKNTIKNYSNIITNDVQRIYLINMKKYDMRFFYEMNRFYNFKSIDFQHAQYKKTIPSMLVIDMPYLTNLFMSNNIKISSDNIIRLNTSHINNIHILRDNISYFITKTINKYENENIKGDILIENNCIIITKELARYTNNIICEYSNLYLPFIKTLKYKYNSDINTKYNIIKYIKEITHNYHYLYQSTLNIFQKSNITLNNEIFIDMNTKKYIIKFVDPIFDTEHFNSTENIEYRKVILKNIFNIDYITFTENEYDEYLKDITTFIKNKLKDNGHIYI